MVAALPAPREGLVEAGSAGLGVVVVVVGAGALVVALGVPEDLNPVVVGVAALKVEGDDGVVAAGVGVGVAAAGSGVGVGVAAGAGVGVAAGAGVGVAAAGAGVGVAAAAGAVLGAGLGEELPARAKFTGPVGIEKEVVPPPVGPDPSPEIL